MKRFTFLAFLLICGLACQKEPFDPRNPDVEIFVQQIKSGTYQRFEIGEQGEVLWLQMPRFTEKHIPTLLQFAEDTSRIQHYPLNPVSSRTPFPADRSDFILGECLLWTVEGIRNGTKYGSLDPFLSLINATTSPRSLTGQEILRVQDRYQEWWNQYQDGDWKNQDPLAGTSYRWH